MTAGNRATRQFWFGLALILLLAGGWLWTHLDGFQWGNDEGMFAMVGRVQGEGSVLYRDIFYDHPPGLPLLLAWAFALWGTTMAVARSVTLGLALAGVAVLGYAIWRAGTMAWAQRRLPPEQRPMVFLSPALARWSTAALLVLLLWLLGMPDAAARLRQLREPDFFSAGWDGVRWVSEHTAPQDAIVSDNGLIAFYTGRAMPPELTLISGKRIRIGRLTAAQLIDSTARARAKAVLIWNNQLTDFPEYMDWLRQHYVLAKLVGEDREIWERVDEAGITHREPAFLDGVATFEGYDLSPIAVRPGEAVTLTLYWRAQQVTRTPYTVFAHLLAADGTTVSQADGLPGGDVDTVRWRPGQIVPDPRRIAVPRGTPPGEYHLHVGLYDSATGARAGARRPDDTWWPEAAVRLATPIRVTP
jgi:hypothetical protein